MESKYYTLILYLLNKSKNKSTLKDIINIKGKIYTTEKKLSNLKISKKNSIDQNLGIYGSNSIDIDEYKIST